MSLNLRTIGKIGFIFVCIGFFMPLGCDGNGFQFVRSNNVGIQLKIALIVLFISAIVGVLSLIKKNLFSTSSEWLIVIVCSCSGLIPFFYYYKKYSEVYQAGTYVIVSGIIFTLILQIVSSVKKE